MRTAYRLLLDLIAWARFRVRRLGLYERLYQANQAVQRWLDYGGMTDEQ